MPASLVPPCYHCGQPSVWGTFVEFEACLAGRQIGVVQFSCGCDGAKTGSLASSQLFPGWKVIRVMDRGIWKLRKLTEEEQNEVCREGNRG